MLEKSKHFLIFILIFATGCSNNSTSDPNIALSQYYLNASTPFKKEAARRLAISSAKDFYIDHPLLDQYFDYTKMVRSNIYKGAPILNAIKNQYGPYDKNEEVKRMDSETVTAEALFKNVEVAANAWSKNNWAARTSNEIFYEYVLPFRIANEKPEYEYRSTLRHKYKKQMDSLYRAGANIRTATITISSILKKEGFQVSNKVMFLPQIRPSKLWENKGGTCWNMSNLTTFVMRSLGIPTTSDFVPQWPTRDGGHSWNIYFDEGGKAVPYSAYGQSFDIYTTKLLKKGKVYRYMGSPQKDALASIKDTSDQVPALFLDPKLKDVTDLYATCKQVSLQAENTTEKFIYLCLYDGNQWKPVSWAKLDGDKAIFTKMEVDVVYLPAIYHKGQIKAIASPFLLKTDGTKDFFDNNGEKQSLILTKVSPLLPHYVKNTMLVGASFQAALNRNFRDAFTIASIPNEPDSGINHIDIHTSKSFRYIRFLPPTNVEAQLAELNISTPTPGPKRIIFNKGRYQTRTDVKLNQAFDGRTDTYYQAKHKNTWFGLDLVNLNKKVRINYAPVVKVDTNTHVKPCDRYALYIWKGNDWHLVSQNNPTHERLLFTNAPKNALYLVKNITKTQRTRMFIYENGKQKFY